MYTWYGLPEAGVYSTMKVGWLLKLVLSFVGFPTADTTLEGQPALFLTGYISPIFAPFSAVFPLFSPP